MTYRMLDMEHYPRKAHFDYFRAMLDPYASVTVKVDVTKLVAFCKKRGFSFYLGCVHIASLAANAVPELRRRVAGEGIREYDTCGSSHIELLDDETYCYCTLFHDMPWEEYIPYAVSQREKYRAKGNIVEDDCADGLCFITTLPWIHYEQIQMPITGNRESNPRISWGKFVTDDRGRYIMPLTLTAHHALADGIHFARFFDNFERLVEEVQ